jgi:hypothetical protein
VLKRKNINFTEKKLKGSKTQRSDFLNTFDDEPVVPVTPVKHKMEIKKFN